MYKVDPKIIVRDYEKYPKNLHTALLMLRAGVSN